MRHQPVVGRAPIILAHPELGPVRADVVSPPDVQRVQRLRQGLAVGLGEGLGIATDHLIGRIAQTAKHRRVQLPVLRACHEFAKVTLARNRHEVVNEYDTRPTIKVEETHFRRGPPILGKMEPKLK